MDPLLKAVLEERFAYPIWFRAPGYEDSGNESALSEIQTARQQKHLEEHVDALTSVLPDQEPEVA